MKVFIFVFMILLNSCFARIISEDEITTLFVKRFRNELTIEDHEDLQKLIDIARRPETASQRALGTGSEIRTTLECIVCRSAFAALFDVVKDGQDNADVIETIRFFCVVLHIESDAVCEGAVALNMPILTYIIKNTPEAAPGTFCSLLMQNAQDNLACPMDDPRFEWEVELPPLVETIASNETSTPESPLTIAILSDAHIDPFYEPFGVADCNEPTCCRVGQTRAQSFVYKSNVDENIVAKSVVKVGDKVQLDLDVATEIRKIQGVAQTRFEVRNSAPAGYWGDYRDCDTPIWAYDDVIDTISETHKNVDVVYYIGDTIDHFVWETTYEDIKRTNQHVIDKIRTSFGDHVPVVPSIGNHESQPTNQFAPSSIREEGINTTWLYEALVDKWGFYLPEEARQTLLEGGDFSVLVKPGLRAISLNNNVAYKYNWWLVYDPTDSKKHLDWLIEELYKAEQAGEKVHILAHIPPGVSDLTHTWTREYNRIVNRFSKTIAAEFNGHTHSDEFKIFFNEDGEPINVAWGAGSATTYSFYNLNYKIGSFDTQTYEPLNIQNYVYNLTEANLTPARRPHWFQLYDMKNTFTLPDLTASSMGQLVQRMVTDNKQLLDLYSAFFSKLSDSRWPHCNTDCKLDNICKTVVTVLWQREKCNELIYMYHT